MNEKIDDDEDDDNDNNNNNWKKQKEAPRKVCNYHLNKLVIERYFLILSFQFYYSSNCNFYLSIFSIHNFDQLQGCTKSQSGC